MHQKYTRQTNNKRNHKSSMQACWNQLNQDKKALSFSLCFQDYLLDIEKITGLPIQMKQRDKIQSALNSKTYTLLSTRERRNHKKAFNGKKHLLIGDWEEETNQVWPKYTENIYNEKGKLIRSIGQLYDFHHIIECSFGGDNLWWNMMPAKHPDQHQYGIHRKGGYAEKLFEIN